MTHYKTQGQPVRQPTGRTQTTGRRVEPIPAAAFASPWSKFIGAMDAVNADTCARLVVSWI